MGHITITAKIQIVPDDNDKLLLQKTMSAYKKACNYVSSYIFRTHDLNKFSLSKALYYDLRSRFGLKSQMAQSVIKSVIARYKSVNKSYSKWIRVEFKKPQYDLVWNRDYSLRGEYFSVNTLCGRIKLSYFDGGMSKYFEHNIYRFGEARLVHKHSKYFLHISVTYEVGDCVNSDVCNVVGVDRGINFIITTYNSSHKTGFVSGRFIKGKRTHYSKLRKELQKRKTSSSRRRLKSIGHRENRWMQDVNHQVSKALIESNSSNTLFVLEDLSGIRSATERVRRKDRYVFVSWSFFDLEKKIIYKAKQNESIVLKVDPKYTSQCCPVCGHIEKSNRNKKIHLFSCKNCNYKSNDDRVGAMNLYHMGMDYLCGGQVPGIVVTE